MKTTKKTKTKKTATKNEFAKIEKDYIASSKKHTLLNKRVQTFDYRDITIPKSHDAGCLLSFFFSQQKNASIQDLLNLIQKITGVNLLNKYRADSYLRDGIYTLTKDPVAMNRKIDSKNKDYYAVSRFGFPSQKRVSLKTGVFCFIHGAKYRRPDASELKEACNRIVNKMK